MKRSIFAVSVIIFLVTGMMVFSDMMSDDSSAQVDDHDKVVWNQGTVVMVAESPNLIRTVHKPAVQYTTYVAKSGDSMSKIAHTYDTTVDRLIELNKQHRPRVLKYCTAVRARMSPEKREMRDGSPILFCNGQLMSSEIRIRLLIEETVQIGWDFKVPVGPKKEDPTYSPGLHKELCEQSGINAIDCKPIWM